MGLTGAKEVSARQARMGAQASAHSSHRRLAPQARDRSAGRIQQATAVTPQVMNHTSGTNTWIMAAAASSQGTGKGPRRAGSPGGRRRDSDAAQASHSSASAVLLG